MKYGLGDYSLFFDFIETYAELGFKGIDPSDPLMVELDEMMEANNQFFYLADAIQINILYTSKGSARMLGIDPEELNFYHLMECTHPDDLQRLNLGRPKMVKIAQDLFSTEKGYLFISSDFRLRNPRTRSF